MLLNLSKFLCISHNLLHLQADKGAQEFCMERMRVVRDTQKPPSHETPEIRLSMKERWVVGGSVRPLVDQKCSQSLPKFTISPTHDNSFLIHALPEYRWDTALYTINMCNVSSIRCIIII